MPEDNKEPEKSLIETMLRLPGEALSAIFRAVGLAIKKLAKMAMDLIHRALEAAASARKMLESLIFGTLVVGSISSFVLLPYLLAIDPMDLTRHVSDDWNGIALGVRYTLAAIFGVAVIIWVYEMFRFITRSSSETEIISSDGAIVTVYRGLSALLSWALVLTLGLLALAYKIDLEISFQNFPNGIPSFTDFRLALVTFTSGVLAKF